MWWNDIKEMKEWMSRLTDRLIRIDDNVRGLVQDQEVNALSSIESRLEDLEETINDTFCSTEENSTFNQMREDISTLICDNKRERAVMLAEKTLDKFEDYMKNVDKLNSMINEFKGCVSMARSAIAERKELGDELKEMKNVARISQDIYNAMMNFIKSADTLESRSYFKLDAIYKAICIKEEKKAPKKRKSPKKVSPVA